MIQNGAAFACFSNSSNAAPPAGLTKSVIVSNWTDSTNISALTFGINPLSSRQDAAWTLLESLYTDTDLMTLLINGIEGTHYVMNEDGSCSYPEGVTSTTTTPTVMPQCIGQCLMRRVCLRLQILALPHFLMI